MSWWNFHSFVAISTVCFYIVLRMYKSDIEKQNQNNFIYVLFVPSVLYLAYFLFLNKSNAVEMTNKQYTLPDSYPNSSSISL